MIDINFSVINISKRLTLYLSTHTAQLRVTWGVCLQQIVMKFWQIVHRPFPTPTCLHSLPWLWSSHLAGEHTPKPNVRMHSAHHWWIEVDKVQRFASILLITPLSYIHSPWKWVSVMLFCQWTRELVTGRKMERKRVGGGGETCMSYATQPASGKFFINSSLHVPKWSSGQGWGANKFHSLSNIIIITNNMG